MGGTIVVVGVSHHSAPVEVRERLGVGAGDLPDELKGAMRRAELTEALLVSTCNRVELFGVARDELHALRQLQAYFSERTDGQATEHMYTRVATAAVHHAFRMTASLDSLVVGEPQILGQVKEAFARANEAGTVGALLSRCFARAFSVAKRVRSETGIAAGAVSVSSIAVQLAESIFGDLAGRRVLLVGAGEMGEAAARALAQDGSKLCVLNRSADRASQVAGECGGEAKAFETLPHELSLADVCITSTASPHYVITPELMTGVIKARRHRPLFLIDIAVPRDVDPRVESMDNVFRYDVDDLSQVADENIAQRRREAERAEHIVHLETEAFRAWLRSLELTPTVVALRAQVRTMIGAELERTLPKLGTLDERSRRSLDAMCDAMTNKLLHQPLTELRRSRDESESAELIAALQRLFRLEPQPRSAQTSGKDEAERSSALPHATESSGDHH